jgi:hypothetical protein
MRGLGTPLNVTTANQRPEEPLGKGGERLHEWAFGEDPSLRVVR